jgi:hypothetical protein
MSRPNWRDPTEYEPLRSVDTPTLAGEFMKRNPDYIADNERLARLASKGQLDAAAGDTFAAAWGVRFRYERRSSDLDGAGAPHRSWRHGDIFNVGGAAPPS